jgi:hypothetical protein
LVIDTFGADEGSGGGVDEVDAGVADEVSDHFVEVVAEWTIGAK